MLIFCILVWLLYCHNILCWSLNQISNWEQFINYFNSPSQERHQVSTATTHQANRSRTRKPTGWNNECTHFYLTHWPLIDLNKILDEYFRTKFGDYLSDDKSTLVQVMAWCRQATSHYLSQCWPRSLLPYDITRPQWVNWFIIQKWSWYK